MNNYMIAYYGGKKPETPEEGAEGMAKWQAWMTGLGEAIVNPGTPLGNSKIVSSNGVTDDANPNRLTGYSIVKADNIETAIKMAETCPFLEMGTIGIAEMMQM